VQYFHLTPDGVPRFPYVTSIRNYEWALKVSHLERIFVIYFLGVFGMIVS
jgi:hypothetical protein